MKNIVLSLIGIFFALGLAAQTEIDIPETQMSLITKRTADWCPFCGEWGWTLKQGLLEDNSRDALVIVAHFSGDLQTEVAFDITSNFGGFGQPRFYLANEDQRASSGNHTEVRESIKAKVTMAALESPVAQTGILTTFDDQNLLVTTRTRFFQPGSGDYYLGMYLIEKERIAPQASLGQNAQHRNLITKSLTESSFGDPIALGSIPSGNEIEWAAGIALEDAPDLENLIVATILWKKEDDQYFFVNTNFSDVFSRVSETTAILTTEELATFKVYPTVATDFVTVELDLNRNSETAAIQLYNMNGQLVESIYQGNLSEGQHRQVWNANKGLPAGLYQLRLVLDGKFAVKPIVLK